MGLGLGSGINGSKTQTRLLQNAEGKFFCRKGKVGVDRPAMAGMFARHSKNNKSMGDGSFLKANVANKKIELRGTGTVETDWPRIANQGFGEKTFYS